MQSGLFSIEGRSGKSIPEFAKLEKELKHKISSCQGRLAFSAAGRREGLIDARGAI